MISAGSFNDLSLKSRFNPEFKQPSLAAIHASDVSLSEPLNPFQPLLTLRFDLPLGGGKHKMNFCFQGSMEDHIKILLAEDWI